MNSQSNGAAASAWTTLFKDCSPTERTWMKRGRGWRAWYYLLILGGNIDGCRTLDCMLFYSIYCYFQINKCCSNATGHRTIFRTLLRLLVCVVMNSGSPARLQCRYRARTQEYWVDASYKRDFKVCSLLRCRFTPSVYSVCLCSRADGTATRSGPARTKHFNRQCIIEYRMNRVWLLIMNAITAVCADLCIAGCWKRHE